MRLGLSQAVFAELAGQKKQSQINYESGERSPDGRYLEAIARAGADVLFIVTGRYEHQSQQVDDCKRLEAAIEAVEKGLEAAKRIMAPAKKAELILVAYDLLAEAKEDTKAQIIRFVRAA